LFNFNRSTMKKVVLLFTAIVLTVTFFACKKSSSGTDSPGGAFSFTNLSISDTSMKVNEITTVTANATGTNLSYHWTASYGTFIGSGAKVQWTVCHSDIFTITCEVSDDNGNKESKTVSIAVRN
jgi:hypothetical protein